MKYIAFHNNQVYIPISVGGVYGLSIIEFFRNPVTVSVLIQKNGTTMTNAVIEVDRVSYTTDANGKITLTGESGETKYQKFKSEDGMTVYENITYTANANITVNIISLPCVVMFAELNGSPQATITYTPQNSSSQITDTVGELNTTFSIKSGTKITIKNTEASNSYSIQIRENGSYKAEISGGQSWISSNITGTKYYVLNRNDSDCTCDCNDCCVAEGTMVLCFENNNIIYKKIEDINSGDIVIGANGEYNEVYARTDTNLGKERAMYTFEDNSLYFTGEHSFWVKYKDQEYFGIHDISSYYREKTATVNGEPILEWEQKETYRKNNIVGKPISKGLSREPLFVLWEAEYGTYTGWKKNRAIVAKDKIYSKDTPIHTLILGGNHTFFANGYLVSGFATDIDYDYSKIKIRDLKIGN